MSNKDKKQQDINAIVEMLQKVSAARVHEIYVFVRTYLIK